MKPALTLQQKLQAMDRGNLECARLILADPAKYPAGSLGELWARMVLDKEQERAA